MSCIYAGRALAKRGRTRMAFVSWSRYVLQLKRDQYVEQGRTHVHGLTHACDISSIVETNAQLYEYTIDMVVESTFYIRYITHSNTCPLQKRTVFCILIGQNNDDMQPS
jgi:hypothetical protein